MGNADSDGGSTQKEEPLRGKNKTRVEQKWQVPTDRKFVKAKISISWVCKRLNSTILLEGEGNVSVSAYTDAGSIYMTEVNRLVENDVERTVTREKTAAHRMG